jgi:hypothetical protein
LFGAFNIAVDFPHTAEFALLSAISDEAFYIFKRIAEEYAYLVWKVLFGEPFA